MKVSLTPLLKVALAFALGIWLADYFGPGISLLAVPGGLLFMALLRTDRHLLSRRHEWAASAALLLTALGLGAFRMQTAALQEPLPPVGWYNCETVLLEGQVVSRIKENEYGRRCWVEVFAVSRGDSAQRVQGRVQLYLKPGVGGHFSMYDTLQVKARLNDLSSRYPSYLAYLRRNGVSHAAYGQALLVAGEAQGPLAIAARVQKRLSKQLEQLMKDSTRLAIAQAMFLGDTDGLRPEAQTAFSQTGTSHVLSISGMHVGIIFLFLNFLLSPLSLLPGGKRLKYGVVLVVLIAYALIAGGAPPVVRSTLMFGTVLIFKILWQRYHLLNVLAAAALAQMLFEPGVIFNVGFQLSYVAVWGIVGLMPKFQAWFSAGHRLLDTVYEWIGVSLAATLATLPLTLAHFGQFPVHFILSNLLVSAIGFVLVLSGFLMVMFCYVPGLNAWLASVCEFLIEVLQAIVEGVSALPHPLIRSVWDWQALLLLSLELGLTALLLLLPRLIRRFGAAEAPALA